MGSTSVEDLAGELYGPRGIVEGVADLSDLRYGPDWLSVVSKVASRGICCSCCVLSVEVVEIHVGLLDMLPGPVWYDG